MSWTDDIKCMTIKTEGEADQIVQNKPFSMRSVTLTQRQEPKLSLLFLCICCTTARPMDPRGK